MMECEDWQENFEVDDALEAGIIGGQERTCCILSESDGCTPLMVICIERVMVHWVVQKCYTISNRINLTWCLKTKNTTTRLHNILNLFYFKSLSCHDHIQLMSNLNDQITLCNRVILDNKDSLDFTRYR